MNLKKPLRLTVYIALPIFALVLVVWLFYKFGVLHFESMVENPSQSKEGEAAALYGDSFGYVNALFSGLALGGVVVALIIQAMEYTLAAGERREQMDAQTDMLGQQRVSSSIAAIQTLHALSESRRIKKELCLRNDGYLLAKIENAKLRKELWQLYESSTPVEKIPQEMVADIRIIPIETANALARLVSMCASLRDAVLSSEYGPYAIRMGNVDRAFETAVLNNLFDQPHRAADLKAFAPSAYFELDIVATITRNESYFKSPLGGSIEYNSPDHVLEKLSRVSDWAIEGLAAMTGCYVDREGDQGAGPTEVVSNGGAGDSELAD